MAAAGIPVDRLKTFAEAYVTTANAAEAARAAGYKGSSKVVSEQARKLLKRPDVQQMIEALRTDVSAARKATREERQAWWTKLMLGEPVPQVIEGKRVMLPASVGARLKASELLGKSEGDFVQKHEHEHKGAVRIVVEIPDNLRGQS